MDKKHKEEKNKAFIGEYKEALSSYIEDRIELAQINAIEKSALLTGKLSVAAIMVAFALFALFFLNISLAMIIGNYYGDRAIGFVAITGFYIFLFLIIVLAKKSIEKPIINFVIKQLFQKSKQH